MPIPLPARQALLAYMEKRPPVQSDKVFIGERGPLTDCGVWALCEKYSTLVNASIHTCFGTRWRTYTWKRTLVIW